MREGTQIARTAALLIQESQRLGRAVTARELIDAYGDLHGPITDRNVTHALARLVEKGIALKVGGRLRRTQYAHHEHPAPFADPSDPAPLIVEVVEQEAPRLGRALMTREVMKGLRLRRFTVLSTDQLINLLKTLAYEGDAKVDRAHPDWRDARIRQIETVTAGGRRRLYWSPREGKWGIPTFADARDAIRAAVGEASQMLDRPASKREVRLWAHWVQATSKQGAASALKRESAAAVLSDRFVPRLDSTLRIDALRPLQDGRVRATKTPLTCRGAYPCRYNTGAVSEVQAAACIVEDLCVLLRPADELASLTTLRETASDLASGTLNRLLAGRECFLQRVVAGFAPQGDDPLAWMSRAVEQSKQARSVLRGWVPCSPGTKYERQAELVRMNDTDRHLDALLGIAAGAAAGIAGAAAYGTAIGEDPGTPLGSFEGLAREVIQLNGLTLRWWPGLLGNARRSKGPTAGGFSRKNPESMYSLLDRPDAIVTLVRACHLPCLSAHVETGAAALGEVLRDASLLMGHLAATPKHDVHARRSLTLALALLGAVPRLGLVCPDPTDPEDAETYFAALALGMDDVDERVRLGAEADMYARGAACHVTESALGRLECGDRLSILD